MLTTEELKFLAYWEEKRKQNKLNPFFLVKGLLFGLITGFLIFISLRLGWYKRANMDANTKLSPTLLIIIIILIAVFVSVLYNSFKYEQNEQLYQELKRKNK